MIRLRKLTLHRSLIVLTTLVSMLFVVSSCGTQSQINPTEATTPQVNHGNVVIFTPADGLVLTRHKPLSTWDRLVPELVKSLKNKGFSNNSIITKMSSSLSEQSQEVQDYVVNLLSPLRSEKPKNTQNNTKNKQSSNSADEIKKKLSRTTLVVAPWASKNGTNNYGDYATLPNSNKTNQSQNKNKNQDQKNSEQSNIQKQTDNTILQSEKRLASSLLLAKKAGMHVVMLSRNIPNFQPDVLFHLSDASSIGETQAATLVQKLALDRATRENPRYIEVLLPCHNQNINNQEAKSQNQNGELYQNSDNIEKNTDSESTTILQDEFAKEAFAGIWKVLRPYFVSGTLLTTSGKLHANSTEKDWNNVAFDADAADAVKTELTSRITRTNLLLPPSTLHVDGIIALDDQIALQTAQTLSDLGYEGSAADINPSFTLPDVIGNFIGKRNITKRPVPAPRDSSKNSKKDSQEEQKQYEPQNKENAKQWPAITGYGAYKNVMPNIVSGKQWMTTIEHQTQIARDITATCDSLNTTGKLSPKLAATPTKLEPGITVPVIREQLLAVSATNLKARLIDPGYISLADAGL